jgi:hypothetical protein
MGGGKQMNGFIKQTCSLIKTILPTLVGLSGNRKQNNPLCGVHQCPK